ncbi:c-type cytochrome [Terrimonas alba]|uniref:c-type cytochrome n=1 Tax=Terrimonas alba TaxID=3349636 RepID=UPI0035F41C0D
MRKSYLSFITALAFTAIFFAKCADNKQADPTIESTAAAEKTNFGGYETQVKWGEHLVTIGGCNDCHTPKKMTSMGPVDDSTLLLSGHPEKLPAPDVDRKQMESKGLVVTSDFTAWIGPWGISYSANLTPDETGTGKWTENQFLYAVRNSISKGLPGSRPLMPPMSMMPVKHMTDDELKAIFAYLRTIKPIKNNSVQPTPPVLPMK